MTRGKAFRVEPPLPSALEGVPTLVSPTSHPLGWLEPERQMIVRLRLWRDWKPRALLAGLGNGAASLEDSPVAPNKVTSTIVRS